MSEKGYPEQDYCGCCSRECFGLWCHDCQQHIQPSGHLWNQTYFAQHNKACPFDESDQACKQEERTQ